MFASFKSFLALAPDYEEEYRTQMTTFIDDGHNRLEKVSNSRSANIREQQGINAKRFALLDDYRKKNNLKAAWYLLNI